MPQLVKGGKHVFGWTLVGDKGKIIIPPEALEEYGLRESDKLIMIPGSKTSGGFGLGTQKILKESPLGMVLDANPALKNFRVSEKEVIEYRGKPYCWTKLHNHEISIPPESLRRFGIEVGDKLLVIRGSGLALGFAVRGPIVEEAGKNQELKVFSKQGVD